MAKLRSERTYLQSDCGAIAGMKRFSHEAMATTFEVLVVHPDERYARQAAAAAFDLADRLELELSRFVESSDIWRINHGPAGQPVVVGLAAFECLDISRRIYDQTKGAFDVTIGSLLKCWRADGAEARPPSQEQLKAAQGRTGMGLLELSRGQHSVTALVEGVQVDLGGIGKGYAVDRMGELLREWGVDTALISGGYSSVLALDPPPGRRGWPVSLTHPQRAGQVLAKPQLQKRAMGSSGLRKGRHIIDPRTGRPVKKKCAAWSSAPEAATADALSTAFMVMSVEEIENYCRDHQEVSAMVVFDTDSGRAKQAPPLRFGCWEQVGST